MITDIEERRQKYDSWCGKARVEGSLESGLWPTLRPLWTMAFRLGPFHVPLPRIGMKSSMVMTSSSWPFSKATAIFWVNLERIISVWKRSLMFNKSSVYSAWRNYNIVVSRSTPFCTQHVNVLPSLLQSQIGRHLGPSWLLQLGQVQQPAPSISGNLRLWIDLVPSKGRRVSRLIRGRGI